MRVTAKVLVLFSLILCSIVGHGQNCSVDFPASGKVNFSSICGLSANKLTLGNAVFMDDGDEFVFDAPAEINLNGNVNVHASGNATITIPSGVTVNIKNSFLRLDSEGNQCEAGAPCTFNFVVNGILNIGNKLDNRVSGLIWSGTGVVNIYGELQNKNGGCMSCGASCPAFPQTTGGCNDNGSCGLNFCQSDGNYGNSEPLATLNAGADQELCNESTAKLAATPGAGIWTTNAANVVITNINDPNTTVTGLTPGDFIFTWTANSVSDDVLIRNLPSVDADAGNDQDLCNFSITFILAAQPTSGVGSWSTVSGPAIVASPSNRLSYVYNMPAGSVSVLRWTVTDGNCSAFDEITITRYQNPSIADAGTPQAGCNLTEITMAANEPGINTGVWTVVSGSATIEEEGNPLTRITGLIPGQDVVMRWTVSNSCSSSFDDVLIRNEKSPPQAFAGTDQFLCDTFSTALAAEGQGGRWEMVNGAATIDEPNNPNSLVRNLNYGQTILRWRIPGIICEDSSDEIMINISPSPSTAEAGADQLFCKGETFTTLNAQVPAIGTGTWTVVMGEATITDENDPFTRVSALKPGETILKWTVSNGTCPSGSDEISIFIDKTFGVEKNSYEICSGESIVLNAFGGTGYVWSPEDSITDPFIANPLVAPQANENYEVNISGNYCPEQTFGVAVIVNPVPELILSKDTTIVTGLSVQLFVAGADRYEWSPEESLDNPSSASPLASPLSSTTYMIKGFNAFNCTAEGEITVDVDNRAAIFIPEMFTPNNDENNDMLFVNTIGIKTLEFKIFNRTGKEIFSTSQPELGWDGTYNGVMQSVDTYVYYVIGRTFNEDYISRKGTIRLIR